MRSLTYLHLTRPSSGSELSFLSPDFNAPLSHRPIIRELLHLTRDWLNLNQLKTDHVLEYLDGTST
jgi:hypothetical protein